MTRTTLMELKDMIANLTEETRSTLTVHRHLSLQAVVLENMVFPLHESSVNARDAAESILREVYLLPIIESRSSSSSLAHQSYPSVMTYDSYKLRVRSYDVVETSLSMVPLALRLPSS